MHKRQQNEPKINRRKFIHQTGLALGVSALAPVLPVFDSAWKGITGRNHSNTLKIGLLLPTSYICPAMSDNFMSGLNLFHRKNHEENSVVLVREKIGYGTASVVEKSEKLIQEDHVDILAGIVSESIPESLHILLEKNNTYLIANHVGANLIRSHDHSPYVIHNSINLWQTNYALGAWAVKNIGNTALVISSFYESGYDAQHAFNAGFESSGGSVIHTDLTNLPAEMTAKNDIFTQINKYHPDLIFASFSGKEAVNFIRDYKRSTHSSNIPLLCSGFAVEGDILPQHGATAEGIYSCMSWDSGSTGSEYVNFAAGYRELTGKSPDLFALLGFEAAALINHATKQSDRNLRDLDFTGIGFISPRGDLTYNSDTHVPDCPLYIRQVSYRDNMTVNVTVEKVDPVKPANEFYVGLKTGWLNPYQVINNPFSLSGFSMYIPDFGLWPPSVGYGLL